MKSSALHNDLYQLTMAYGYWKNGLHEQQTCFHQGFRTLPFEGGFAVACGQGLVREWLENFRFGADDCAYLGTLQGRDGKSLFDSGFLKYLETLRLELEIDAVEEGEIVFGHQPLLRVCGPVLHCQLIETALLTLMNFSTLIATKAARVCLAAGSAAGAGIWGAAGAGFGWRAERFACGVYWRLRGDLERFGGQNLRHSVSGHARAFVGDVVQ